MLLLLLFLLIPESGNQLLQRGLVLLQQGDLVQARAALEQATKQEPRNAYTWASLAETYLRLKQTPAADSAAQKAEQLGVDIPAISHALTMYYSKLGQYERAAQFEQRFAESPQADASALERAAALFLNAGQIPKAMVLAEKAFKLHPSPSAEDVFGRALIASGRAEDGKGHLRLAWETQKTDSRLAFDFGQALLHDQDFDKAADVVRSALEAHPSDAQLILVLGVARYGQRRFDDAISAFLDVIRIDPAVEQPYVFLGKVLDQAGSHLPQITAAYETWSIRNPRNAVGLLLLAKAKLAANPLDSRAEALLWKSAVLDAGNWETHYQLGVLLEGKRDWARAAVELRKAVELDEKEGMPHYHLARVYERQGQVEKAKAERALHDKLIGGEK